MVKYVYDAWGNYKILNADGEEVTEGIGVLNPFRYRGYYYDTRTGLYYLQTRFYDPEVGRFISQDSIEYADPETINGLNLYAYCLDNPVMAVDPDGTMPKLLKWLIGGLAFLGAVALTALTGGSLTPVFVGMGVSIAAGGLIQGTVTAINGGSFWDGFTEGAADGALWGGIFALGGAVLRTAQIFTKGVVIGETMTRVNSAARQIGAATYKAPGKNLVKLFGKSKAFELNKALNRAWINRMKRWGVKIVDIGLDFSRTIRSPFYALEQSSVGSYWFLTKTLW